MLYAFICTDNPNSLSGRKEHRPAHLARLQALLNEGRLILAGPHPAIDASDPGSAGFTGSLIVAEFDSLTAARAWADTDPFLKLGIYKQIEVKPFIQALP